MQVVDVTSLVQVCHQVASSVLPSSSCIKCMKIILDGTLYLRLDLPVDTLKQLASSLEMKRLEIGLARLHQDNLQ